MLNDAQKASVSGVYRALDIDGNGTISKADLDAMAQRLCENQQLSKGSPQYSKLTEKFDNYWRTLAKHLDRNLDGRVTEKELYNFYEQVVREPNGEVAHSVEALIDVVFDVADRDGNGVISQEEFGALTHAYQIPAHEAKSVFQMIDTNGDGQISRDEWRQMSVGFLKPDGPVPLLSKLFAVSSPSQA